MTETETVTVVRKHDADYGIMLPYTVNRALRYDDGPKVETGEVFVSMNDIAEVADQDNSMGMGSVLLLGYFEGMALEQAGYARQETRGGYYKSDTTRDLLDQVHEGYRSLVSCPECGGTKLTSEAIQVNKTDVVDGRLRLHDVDTRILTSCEECSATVRTETFDEFMGRGSG